MDGILLFFHLGGLSFWLGSAVLIAAQLLVFRPSLNSADAAALAGKMIRLFNRVTHPSAFIVLLSGIWMLMRMGMENHDDFPFWLKFMEQFGAMVILAFIVAVSILGKRLTKRLSAGDPVALDKGMKAYVLWILIFAALILVVVYVVSGKF